MPTDDQVQKMYEEFIKNTVLWTNKLSRTPLKDLNDILLKIPNIIIHNKKEVENVHFFKESVKKAIQLVTEKEEQELKLLKIKQAEQEQFESQLKQAMAFGDKNIEEMKKLLSPKKMSQDVLDGLLIDAVRQGFSQIVNILLEENANPNTKVEEMPLVTFALKLGPSHFEIVAQLGNHPDIDMKPSLLYAIQEKEPNIGDIQLLLSHPTIDSEFSDEIKEAVEKAKIGEIDPYLFMKLTARLGEKDLVISKLSQYSKKELENFLSQDEFGNILLMENLSGQNIDLSSYLLDQGVNPFIQDQAGDNALMKSCILRQSRIS